MTRLKLVIVTTLSFFSFFIVAVAQTSPAGTIKGKIIDKATKQIVSGATVSIRGTKNGTSTDTAGNFILAHINEGVYQLVVSVIGYQEKIIYDVRVMRNKTYYIEIEIEEFQLTLKEVTVRTLKYENNPRTPVSTHGFSREEISRNPGAQGDIFRAIGMLPGVSSSGGQYSAIAVRGQGVRDNIYMVDDIPVTEVGHLEGNGGFNDPNGGRFSIFAPRVIDNAQFQGGGIPAQYGRRSASYLGLGIKEGNKEDFSIDGQLDLLGFTINYDGPSYVLKNTSLFVSARNQDFRQLMKLLDIKGMGVPKYSDFIFKSTTQLGTKNKLSAIAIVSPDDFLKTADNVKVQVENLEQGDDFETTLVNSSSQKNIFGLNLRTLTGKNSYWKNVLYYTKTKSDVSIGRAYPKIDSTGNPIKTDIIPFEDDIRVTKYTESKLGYRSVFNINLQNHSKLTAGIDVDRTALTNYRRLSRTDTSYVFGPNDFRPSPIQYYSIISPTYYNADFNDATYNASAYIDYSFLLFKKITLNTGARYDYTGFTGQSSFSPRLSGNFQLSETNSINFAAGIYHQDPVYSEIADQPKNKKLKQEQVINFILGYKKQFSPDLKLTIEGWYKTFDKMIVRPVSGYSEQTNSGTGWASGIDLNVTKRLTKRIHGQIGYSYMQSKRNDHDGLGEYDFAFSQPHQFNFLISYKANNHWILASKFRYATGKPTDKFIIHSDVFNDPNFIRYSQEIVGKNKDRFSDFISLDVRADYRFQIKRLGLTTFIDIVNVLDRKNESSRDINPYTGKIITDELGMFPTFGLKFEY